MSVNELNRDQIISLKQKYLCESNDNVSFEDLAFSDDIVADDVIFRYFGDTDFTCDDFPC